MAHASRSRKREALENFKFAVEDWSFDYYFFISEALRVPHLGIGRCIEGLSVTIVGPLKSETRRRIERVKLKLNPGGTPCDQLRPETRGLGTIISVDRGFLHASLAVPDLPFQSLVAALSARRVAGAYIGVENMTRTSGLITAFKTDDLEDWE